MLTIKELTVKNFMSVGNATQSINFANKNLVLVIGENLDLGGDDAGARNGTGKTTIINALSYVFSNEGVPHGYSLSSCTTVAHKFNKSIFYDRFKEAIEKLGFDKLELKEDVSKAADTVMTDRGHLDPNPIPVSKEDVMKCLEDIKAGNL